MCLKRERKSKASPETEVIGYVIMYRTNSLKVILGELQRQHSKNLSYTDGQDTFRSLYADNVYEPTYKLNEWYSAKYLPSLNRVKYYLVYDDPSKYEIPGFHAFKSRSISFLRCNKVHHCIDFIILKAKFKGIISYGEFKGQRCFRAKYRKLLNVENVIHC